MISKSNCVLPRTSARGQVSIFDLDRIKMLHRTEDTLTVTEDFDLEEFMRSSFGVFQEEPIRIRVWFSSDIAGNIADKAWQESQKIQHLDDGSVIFEPEGFPN